MTMPPGFKVQLVAAEPEVVQPIAFTIDGKGRLWVVEGVSYPNWTVNSGPRGRDRVLIFEDRDGDGSFETRKVFWDKGDTLTGIAVGFGGVWLCATPNLLFLPDRNGDDVLDGAPEVVLDGWDVKAQHNLFNGLSWGPDGWLWGCNGILSNSMVGAPGTPTDKRVSINCGVWRYHPTRKVFEAVAHGTTNPWGLDFNDVGEAFLTNCVIPHLYRVVPGAHLERMFGANMNPYAYDLIKTSADHIHWAGGRWQDSRQGQAHSDAGGGHAHVGAMFYLGDNWPDAYRDSVYTFNIHGHRVNRDKVTRKGASYVATHEPDFFNGNHEWFRGLELKYGPDGAVFFTEWTDHGECHETDADGAHRENGRIYKLSYGDVKPVKVDLDHASDAELVAYQAHKNDWYVRTARRILQERAAAGKPMAEVHAALRKLLTTAKTTPSKLRALWALSVTGGLDSRVLQQLLANGDEHIRSWSVRLIADSGDFTGILGKFAEMSRSDSSPLVRLWLASALQKIPVAERWGIAEGLVSHAEDATDPTLPLMVWYGVEPLAVADRAKAVELAGKSKLAVVRQFLARRMVADNAELALAAMLPSVDRADDAYRRDALTGLLDGLRGRKSTARPSGWAEIRSHLLASSDPVVRRLAVRLAILFDDPEAIAILESTLQNGKADAEERLEALDALTARKVPGLVAKLQALLDQPSVRGAAIRALAAFDDPKTVDLLLDRYARLSPGDRLDALQTLAARPASARRLLDAIQAGAVSRKDVPVATARQIAAFGDKDLSSRLESVWGSLRATSKEKVALINKYQSILADSGLRKGDPARGRAVFNKSCVNCHRLYDGGGDLGPELTGSDRANAVYLLENILDPSASVGRDYKLATVATRDGRLLSGIIKEQTPAAITVQTVNEKVVLSREDVEELKAGNLSAMPEGLLDPLSPEEIRDLFAYLATRAQVLVP